MITELDHTFSATLRFMAQCVEDLSGEELTAQPPGLPNHAAWTLGHIIYSCQAIGEELGLAPWLPADWESRFGQGSRPDPDPACNPDKSELLALLREGGARVCEGLRDLSPERLARPLPEEVREVLPTLGHALVQVLGAHTAFHAGQLAAWRRALGRAPAGIFV